MTQVLDNADYVRKLRALADRLEETNLPPFDLLARYIGTKETLVAEIKALGGKWTKEILSPDREYSVIQFKSDRYPVKLVISRDSVCTKKVVYDCQPIFAPGEAESLLEETNGL